MQTLLRSAFSILLLSMTAPVYGQATPIVAASVKTTLKTSGKQIRQFAFDGDPDSYFASAQNAGVNDYFTLMIDQPVNLKSITVTTGKPRGGDALGKGILEISSDGTTFKEVAAFQSGIAKADLKVEKITAIRIRPTKDLKHPLAIREIVIDSTPTVAVFKYPIEFIVDVSDAPDMKTWAEQTAQVCERQYRMINDELSSPGFKPRTIITMTLKNDYKGVAAAGGGNITGSVKFFKDHPKDVGAMIHETVHCVQEYRTRGSPGWLVEGIADYIRFFKYEPNNLGRIKKDPHFNDSYRTSAAFLNFVAEKYDKALVRKLNKSLREGEYREEIWKALTKKTIQELDADWRESLKKSSTSAAPSPIKTFSLSLILRRYQVSPLLAGERERKQETKLRGQT